MDATQLGQPDARQPREARRCAEVRAPVRGPQRRTKGSPGEIRRWQERTTCTTGLERVGQDVGEKDPACPPWGAYSAGLYRSFEDIDDFKTLGDEVRK